MVYPKYPCVKSVLRRNYYFQLNYFTGVGAPASPLRKNSQAGKEPFDKHIAKMLQRITSQPIMKGATGAQLTNVECLKILTRSVKVCSRIFRVFAMQFSIVITHSIETACLSTFGLI